MNNSQPEDKVRELARTAAYHKGPAMTYNDVAQHCPKSWPARFIAEQCELAGFPVWTSAPEEALYGVQAAFQALITRYRSCPDAAQRSVLLTEIQACRQKMAGD